MTGPATELDWGWATEYDDVAGAVAVCGVGESDHTKASGRTVQEIVALPGRTEGEVIEVADLFVRRDGDLVRAQGYPPHEDRFRRAGFDLVDLLGGRA